MRLAWNKRRAAAGILMGLGLFLTGCGGGEMGMAGGNGDSAPTNSPTKQSKTLAKFDVDVQTGKVKITKIEDKASTRAVLTGSAVSFASSELLSVGGDSGKRLLKLTVTNNTREGSLTSANLILGNLSNTVNTDVRAAATVSTFAGNGTAATVNGLGTAAQFNNPAGVVAGSGINSTQLFVSERASHVIRRIFGDGSVTTFAGTAGAAGLTNGAGANARFRNPGQLAVDSSGNIFVADTGNNAIRRITPTGEVTTIAGTGAVGADDGAGNEATFNAPRGIAVAGDGNYIWVADTGNTRIRLVSYSYSGQRHNPASYTTYTIAGSTTGYVDGADAAAKFKEPVALAITTNTLSPQGLFVVDRQNHAIRYISNPTSSYGKVSTIAGNGTAGNADGVGTDARLDSPVGVATMTFGSLSNWVGAIYVSEAGANHRVRVIFYRPGNEPAQSGNYSVYTMAGATPQFADGKGNAARFNDPLNLFAVRDSDYAATLYIADRANNRVRKLVLDSGGLMGSDGSPTAIVEPVRLVNWDSEVPEPGKTTWSKAISVGGSSLPGSTTTDLQFYIPRGVSGFSFTALVEADTSLTNLPAAGATYIRTLAGDGRAGESDGLPKQAQFSTPYGVVAIPPQRSASFGGIRALITEGGNHRIRAIYSNGYVGTFAGSGRGFADGNGTSALFDTPFGIALTPDGNIVVADWGNRRIRRITPGGLVTTIAGTGGNGFADGLGNAATFNTLRGITVDSGGAIFVTDAGAQTVRKIVRVSGDPAFATSYRVTTVAGTANMIGSADGAGAAARFNTPHGIAADTDGRIYVADQMNHTIRVLSRGADGSLQVATLAGAAGQTGTFDRWGAAARFNRPTGVTVDSAHNLYIVDSLNNRVRRISPLGEVITLAGSTAGFTDGQAGTLNRPSLLDIEAGGNLLVADTLNHSLRAVNRLLSETPNGGNF